MLYTINSSSKLALIMLLHYYSIILLDSKASPSSKPPKELSQSLQRCDYWNSELSIPNVVYTSLYGNQLLYHKYTGSIKLHICRRKAVNAHQ